MTNCRYTDSGDCAAKTPAACICYSRIAMKLDQIERDRLSQAANEIHQRCFHCGEYVDECQCNGGIS